MTKRVAVIENDTVINVKVVPDDWSLAPNEEFVDGTIVGPKWKVNNGVFERPVQQKYRHINISKVDFLDRFTFAELEDLETKAETTPRLRVVTRYLDAADKTVDLESPRLDNMLDILVQQNVITQPRKAEILAVEEI